MCANWIRAFILPSYCRLVRCMAGGRFVCIVGGGICGLVCSSGLSNVGIFCEVNFKQNI